MFVSNAGCLRLTLTFMSCLLLAVVMCLCYRKGDPRVVQTPKVYLASPRAAEILL